MVLEKSKILCGLGVHYRKSKLGRTGEAAKDFSIRFGKLIEDVSITRSSETENAINELLAVERLGGLTLDRDQKDFSSIIQIRVSRIQENELFKAIGELSPKQERMALSELFESYINAPVPDAYRGAWNFWCQIHSQNALKGKALAAFNRDKPEEIKEILELIVKLFKWPHASQISLVSGVLCGDTTRIHKIYPRLIKVLNTFTDGSITGLQDFGIILESCHCHFHGRIRLHINRTIVDFSGFRSGIKIEDIDIHSLIDVDVSSPRCVVVQKEAAFYELVKLNCGDLLVRSDYPNEPTVKFLQALPDSLDFWFFGNSDAIGFDVLRELRKLTGKSFKPLHMNFRSGSGHDNNQLLQTERKLLEALLQAPEVQDMKPWIQDILENNSNGNYEQETLGVPTLDWFPYFESNRPNTIEAH